MPVSHSELEAYLKGQLGEAAYESAGQFTLAREQALQKLASFQLPDPNWWILKVVQAAVASEAAALVVRQTSTDTKLVFAPSEPWTLNQVEEALYDPEPSPWPGLDHLKRGLWSAAFNQHRPFMLTLGGQAEALVWRPEGPQRLATGPAAETCLTVSHRSVEQGKGLPLLRHIEAARLNATLAEILRERAHTCPIPLSVDGRRLDAFQAHPTLGQSNKSFPLLIATGEFDGPELGLPAASWGQFRPDDTAEPQPEIQSILEARPNAACMLSFHAKQVTEKKRTFWKLLSQPSLFHWVLDGVVIGTEALDLDQTSVSAAVYASASGLKIDISGFAVLHSEEAQARLRAACAALEPPLAGANLSLEKMISNARMTGRVLGGILLVGGALLSTVIVPHGLMMLGFGAYQAFSAGQQQEQLESLLQNNLRTLQYQWPRMSGEKTKAASWESDYGWQ